MTDLADRIRTARVGSRDLDADLYEAAGFCVKRRPEGRNGIAWKYAMDYPDVGRRWLSMRHLTRDLEAALVLVPPGRVLDLLIYADGRAAAVLGAGHGSPPSAFMRPVLAAPALAVCHACFGVEGWGSRL